MAQPPNIIDKVNYLIDFIDEPCHAPWFVYVETAVAPAFGALIDLFSFGWDDYVRGRARPRDLRGKRHYRIGRKGGKKGGGIPELGEEIGKGLNRGLGGQRPLAQQGSKAVFLIDMGLQRAAFWWMVADVSVDFFYNWSTALHKAAGCGPVPNDASLWQDTDIVGGASHDWVGVGIKNNVYGKPASPWPTVFTAGAKGGFFACGGSAITPRTSNAAGLQYGVSVNGSNNNFDWHSDPINPTADDPGEAVASASLGPGDGAAAVSRTDAGFYNVGEFFAFGMSNP